MVIYPSYWCYGDAKRGLKIDKNYEIKLVNSLCVSRAFENETIFVYCNSARELNIGKIQDTLIGHPQITIPFKGAIKKLNHNKEKMFIQEIDTDILKNSREII